MLHRCLMLLWMRVSPAHDLPLKLCFVFSSPPLAYPLHHHPLISPLLISLYFKPHSSSLFLSSNLSFLHYFCLFLLLSFSSCRCCAWSRLRWLWSCPHSRMPPSPLLPWQLSSLPTSPWWCSLCQRCSDSLLTPIETAANTEGCTQIAVKSKDKYPLV